MKLQYIFYLSFLLTLTACSKATLPSYPAKWVNSWPGEDRPAQYDSLSKVYYEASRDETNLYLHLSTQDAASQMRIMRYGLSIWLDQSAKKKTQNGFSFPIAPPDSVAGQGMGFGRGRPGGERGGDRPPREEGRGGRGNKGGNPPGPEEMQKRMLNRIYKRFNEKPKELVQFGYDGNKKKTYVLGTDPSDIQVDLEIEDDNSLHYFAVIPLKKIFTDTKYKGDLVSIGIVSGYLELDPENPMMGGGRAPSDGGGGPRAFFMQMMAQMATPIEIWFQSNLKSKKK